MRPEQLRQYLEFYRDLGIREIYVRAPVAARAPETPSSEKAQPASGVAAPAPGSLSPTAAPPRVMTPPAQPASAEKDSPSAPALPGAVAGAKTEPQETRRRSAGAPKKSPAPPEEPSPLSPPPPALSLFTPLEESALEGDSLERILADIGPCTRCRLHEGRNRIVFGDGNPQAPLVFVGEGPGADEDAQGIPFVGAAGQLLTTMIENTAAKEGIPLKRKDVYICNVVKCRPPQNRNPLPDEMSICGQFLYRQLMVIKPKAICALGATAAKALLNSKESVGALRGKWHHWRGIPLMVTYHPSFLLRSVSREAKRQVWEDLKKVLHYVYD